jgi:citrate synthase
MWVPANTAHESQYSFGERFPVALAAAMEREAHMLIGEQLKLDFALVAISSVLNLPKGSAITLFTLGRAMGWIRYVIERYQTTQIIRPRVRYIGEQPTPQP